MTEIHVKIKRYGHYYWVDIFSDGIFFGSMRVEKVRRSTYGYISLVSGYTHIIADTAELINE